MYNLLYYKCHQINLNRGGSYIDSSSWIKKQTTINPIHDDEKCFQQGATAALWNKKSWKKLQRISKIKPFINKINWKGINYSSRKDEWKKFEKNSLTIAPNVLYLKELNIYPAYI